MFMRKSWPVALAAVALLFGAKANAQVGTGVVNAYTACYDSQGVQTAISISAYQTGTGAVGRFSWVAKGRLNISPFSGVHFDSVTHLTMESDFMLNGASAHAKFVATRPGANGPFGSAGLLVTNNADGSVIYSTGINADGSVHEMPLWGWTGTWIATPVSAG